MVLFSYISLWILDSTVTKPTAIADAKTIGSTALEKWKTAHTNPTAKMKATIISSALECWLIVSFMVLADCSIVDTNSVGVSP